MGLFLRSNEGQSHQDSLSETMAPVIWVLGGPGSGKGTQCEMIKNKFEYQHLSSGELLRNEVMMNSERGMQIFTTMEKGNLVPNEIVINLLAEAMMKNASAKGFLIDGFPANVEQAELFEQKVGAPEKIINLELNEEVMKGRLGDRGNFDDNKEAILKRIATYTEQTKPVLAKYSNTVKKVNADPDKDKVFASICALLS